MQFRPVVSVHAGECASPADNPPPEASATLPGSGGPCYDLGPAQLTVTRAEASVQPTPSGKVDLDFVLGPADAKTFDQVAADNYQRQVAVVMFGRVESAPRVNAAQFDGRGQISSLTLEEAAKAKAALAG
jgi:preprotein translocase subunit SecD